MKKGREEGKKLGREEGIEIGEARERQKAQAEKIETAKKMLQDGMSIENVSKYTGLTHQQISELT